MSMSVGFSFFFLGSFYIKVLSEIIYFGICHLELRNKNWNPQPWWQLLISVMLRHYNSLLLFEYHRPLVLMPPSQFWYYGHNLEHPFIWLNMLYVICSLELEFLHRRSLNIYLLSCLRENEIKWLHTCLSKEEIYERLRLLPVFFMFYQFRSKVFTTRSLFLKYIYVLLNISKTVL